MARQERIRQGTGIQVNGRAGHCPSRKGRGGKARQCRARQVTVGQGRGVKDMAGQWSATRTRESRERPLTGVQGRCSAEHGRCCTGQGRCRAGHGRCSAGRHGTEDAGH
jgi:hypothetical protein